MTSACTESSTLIRKIAVGGESGFLDACLDAIDDEYRKSVLEVKTTIKSRYIEQLNTFHNQRIEKTKWWIGFGKFLSFHKDINDEIQKHDFGMDLIGLFLKMNIFVLSLVNEKTLGNNDWFSLFFFFSYFI